MTTQIIIVVTVFLFLILFPSSGSAITCSDVLNDLSPCVEYLKNGSGMPPSDCCTGATALSNAATSSDDKKAICTCIKNTVQKINPNAQLAQALPQNCGITLPVPVSPNVDHSDKNSWTADAIPNEVLFNEEITKPMLCNNKVVKTS